MKYDFQVKAIFAKPCPLCGSRNVVTESKKHFYGNQVKSCSYIQCADCGVSVYGEPVRKADGGFTESYNIAQHEALKLWNRRTA